MNLFSCLLLLLIFSQVPFEGYADSHFPLKGSWHSGELSKNAANLIHRADVIPCSGRGSSSGKEGLKSTAHLLCKRQEQQLQLWQQGAPPSRNRMTSVPNAALLEERENDLSAYNWNVFGLRYGKRQAMNARKKLSRHGIDVAK